MGKAISRNISSWTMQTCNLCFVLFLNLTYTNCWASSSERMLKMKKIFNKNGTAVASGFPMALLNLYDIPSK